jgi:hypothetical protein
MTLYLDGFRETAPGVRRPVRVALADIPSMIDADIYFYGWRDTTENGVRREVRVRINEFDGA